MDIDFCEKYDMFPRAGHILCAVSGGKDSMYLLERLRALAPVYGFELSCAHFDHCLRGAESDRDREFVVAYCKAHEIPCYVGFGDVLSFAAQKGLGTEEAARFLRYAFLEKTADEIGANRIATAHTADDNAETLLLNLVRGSGLKGLCGIPPVRGRIIRPLLETSACEVLRELTEKGIPHVEDSTNDSDDYTRNSLRHRVIPELRSLNYGFDANLLRCQGLLREDEDYLSMLASDFYKSHFENNRVSAAAFAALPRPVSARVLLLAVPQGLTAVHIQAVRSLAASAKQHAFADLPGLRVARDYDSLVFGASTFPALPERVISAGMVTALPEAGLEIFCEFIENAKEVHNSFNIFYFQSDSICGNIFVKSRSEGQKIRLAGRNCTKTLKKLFSEAKLNDADKMRVPVFYDDKGVIAVGGFGIAERCAPRTGTGVIKLTIRPISSGEWKTERVQSV